MAKLFGTDGIRGTAGQFPLDYPSIHTLGKTLAVLLSKEGLEPKVIIGRDTRESGTWMEAAVVCGIRDGGGEAVSAGIIPTSAISFLAKKRAYGAGLVLSASHNPFHDNGIKIFSSDGMKIRATWEKRLEEAILRRGESPRLEQMHIRSEADCLDEYAAFLKSRFPSTLLPGGTRIVLDCSNGAASFIAPRIFRELGFAIEILHVNPDGKNINKDCGSLHPEALADRVLETKADLGIAFDGDADRAVWVDEKGRVLNGDHTLYVQGLFMKENGRLRSGKVVATSMSNMGLEKAFEKNDLRLVRTKVGDKYVLEEMIRLDANLGGEQSGHTIFLDDIPTGDGILTSLKMVEAVLAQGNPLSQLLTGFEEFPQVLINVRVVRKDDFRAYPDILGTIEDIRRALGESGRLDVRYSGTEPLARIMIEGPDKKKIEKHACALADAIKKRLGK